MLMVVYGTRNVANICLPAIIAPHQGKPQDTCINSKAFCNNPTGVKEPSPALCNVCSPNAFCGSIKIYIIIILVFSKNVYQINNIPKLFQLDRLLLQWVSLVLRV